VRSSLSQRSTPPVEPVRQGNERESTALKGARVGRGLLLDLGEPGALGLLLLTLVPLAISALYVLLRVVRVTEERG